MSIRTEPGSHVIFEAPGGSMRLQRDTTHSPARLVLRKHSTNSITPTRFIWPIPGSDTASLQHLATASCPHFGDTNSRKIADRAIRYRRLQGDHRC